ncbi:LEAF RUST 10 DISEASE-RESISTANCE LOCUS RECEPTOR-LIKE PROTEIN KINASE-like 1.2 [Impatiens glandulifera]|uniref:LEAF RUST 10 DISEASE-RESISTANCE LOCUS RECEPTOR-LIKE PROTEIN KINASE-like 1.2 n=1 Tax=Impatiens glandulifera TaxID=253017 RepID=UPI001FB0FC38|nr:LEAF RUST 10 DISEASE-RESISTANCE LOCUS RECEPTOR-LIKE PROTEIN KINASE-like 1.2 [Impatiens glandulifera]
MNASIFFVFLILLNIITCSGQNTNCQPCENLGGTCENENGGFVCICHDGQGNPTPCIIPKDHKRDWLLKTGIAIGASVFTLLVVALVIFLYRRRNKQSSYANLSWLASRLTWSSQASPGKDIEKDIRKAPASNYFGVQVFTCGELDKATCHFNSSRELGDGGFASVYLGKLRDGRLVAVKRLHDNNYKRFEQFVNEIELLARLRHKNLVTLYGCTSYKSQTPLLVYEYISNGTIADHLHGKRSSPGSLSWNSRMSIAVETATALSYLHASDVIHRDVKTANILLDDNFTVKVADFGLSRLFPTHVTHVSTAPQGTPGYVDPEYHKCYQLTDKSDVYSFGVVLIELISSMPAVDITRHRREINLSDMAINKIQCHTLHELVDPAIGYESDYKTRMMVDKVAELAFQCLQDSKDFRPTMDEVLEILQGIQKEGFELKHDGDSEFVDLSSSEL